jgi:hypothetical protein
VNSPGDASRKSRDEIRAAIHKLPTLLMAEAQKAVNSIKGRIQHVAQFNPGVDARLARYLQSRLAENSGDEGL